MTARSSFLIFTLLLSFSRSDFKGRLDDEQIFDVVLDPFKESARLCEFAVPGPYDFNITMRILPDSEIDPDGTVMQQVILMRFVYLYFINGYGGIDFFPFTNHYLQLIYNKIRLWPKTEIRLAYNINASVTKFFLPAFFRENHNIRYLKVPNRIFVKAHMKIALTK